MRTYDEDPELLLSAQKRTMHAIRAAFEPYGDGVAAQIARWLDEDNNKGFKEIVNRMTDSVSDKPDIPNWQIAAAAAFVLGFVAATALANSPKKQSEQKS